MKQFLVLILLPLALACKNTRREVPKIFDVHLHGAGDPAAQMAKLRNYGIYKAALSSSWDLQNSYRHNEGSEFLYGLMFPCPEGKVPYSLQPCFSGGEALPDPVWVEQQIRDGKINFFGEILTKYYGIAPDDSILLPYYELAQRYKLPVGIHTGGAGPDHGSPNFKMEMGNPALLEGLLSRFSELRLWIMHAGDRSYTEAIRIMQNHPRVYADISVISNPDIVPPAAFADIMKAFLDAGLQDRIMFGTDNGDIEKILPNIESLDFLTPEIKDKIYYKNAESFFGSN